MKIKSSPKIDSKSEKEITKQLFKFASTGKSKAIITLSELEDPEEYKKKIEALNRLRREMNIKNYKLLPKPEEVKFQHPDDYDETYFCNASITFDPRKIIKHFKTIHEKEIAEENFKNETVLSCDELRFGLDTGNVIYRDTVANLKPDSKEYNLLKEFLEHPNRRRSTARLTGVLFPSQKGYPQSPQWKKLQGKVKWFVNNIRKKLEMYDRNPINKDLFEPCNGYRIRCKKK